MRNPSANCTANQRSSFTLIEMLAVIVIISLLAALINTAIIKAKKNATKVKRRAEISSLSSAIRAYRYEYQEWPCPNPGAYSNDNHIIIHDWLMNGAAGRNERNIRYLNLSDYSFDSLSMRQDPFHHQEYIRLIFW